MKVIENVKSKDMWPTTTYTFTVNNIDNEYVKNKVLEKTGINLELELQIIGKNNE